MKLYEIANMLEALNTEHDLDGLDIILINKVNNLHTEAFVTRVMKDFKLCSPATTHSRIKKLIKKELLSTELDGGNLRTKRLVLTDKTKDTLDRVLRHAD